MRKKEGSAVPIGAAVKNFEKLTIILVTNFNKKAPIFEDFMLNFEKTYENGSPVVPIGANNENFKNLGVFL